MTLLQALILGAVQGIAEFLPISSSAHLTIARWLMGCSEAGNFLYFDLLCHSGTLLALVIYLRKEIFAVLQSPKTISFFLLALLPLVPIYFLLKPVRIAASNPAYLGYFLICTSCILFLASKKRPAQEILFSPDCRIKYRDVLCIGMMQTMALLPGVSRSGSTIATARILGWDWKSAARFSFLLAIPAILGGQLLETWKILSHTPDTRITIASPCYIAGFLVSFIVGTLSVRFIFWIYEKGNVRPFAWYCLAIGILTAWAL